MDSGLAASRRPGMTAETVGACGHLTRVGRQGPVPDRLDVGDLGFEALEKQPRRHAQGAARRLDHHELGVERRIDDRIDDELALADVVHRDEARQHRDPVGARDEFERADHGVHFQHGGDLDAVGLEIGLEVAAADIVGPGHHDLQRGAIGEPHRRERRKTARAPRQQHLAIAHQQSRFQSDPALEGRHQREIELVRQHHVGQHAAVALEHVQAHIGMARHEILERRRQHRAGEGRHQPDAQIAGDEAGEAARLLAGILEPADGLDAALVVAQPRRRGRDRRAPTVRTASPRARARRWRRAARCRTGWRFRVRPRA